MADSDIVDLTDPKSAAPKVTRFSGKVGVINRVGFAVLSGIRKRTHFVKDNPEFTGYFHCLGDGRVCCEHLGSAKTRYAIPVIIYKTDDQGKLLNQKPEMMPWVISEDRWRFLMSLHEDTPLLDNDLKIQCTDEQYQKLQIYPVNGHALKKAGEGGAKILEEMKAKAMEFLKSEASKNILGMTLGEERIRKIVGEAPVAIGTKDTTDAEFASLVDGLGE